MSLQNNDEDGNHVAVMDGNATRDVKIKKKTKKDKKKDDLDDLKREVEMVGKHILSLRFSYYYF